MAEAARCRDGEGEGGRQEERNTTKCFDGGGLAGCGLQGAAAGALRVMGDGVWGEAEAG